MITGWPGIEVVADPADYRARAKALARGGKPDAPIPVLDNPAMQDWLAAAPAPAQLAPSAAGVVILAECALAPAGLLLGRYTGREVRYAHSPEQAVAAAESAGTPATIVVEPDAVGPDFLAALPPTKPISVFTARHLAAASNLVLRTLAYQASLEMSAATLDATTTPAATTQESRQFSSTPHDLVTIRAHGRECGLLLRDGMLCGRDRTTGSGEGAAATRPLTACEQGQGCFRNGWQGNRIVPIAEINAKVILVDSCRALRVANGEFQPTVSLALATLDGSALAFVGSTWLRSQELDIGQLIAAQLRLGQPLSVAVAAANASLDDEPEAFGPLAVLGDGGIRLCAQNGRPGGDGAPAGSAVNGAALPARRVQVTASALPVSDLVASCELCQSSPRLRSAAARLPGVEAGSRSAVADLQRQLIGELLTEIAAKVYSFQEAWPRPLTRVGVSASRCRSCGSAAAVGYRFVTPALPSRTLVMEICPRCTEQREGLGVGLFDWRIDGPGTVYRGEAFTQTLVVRNLTANPLHGCAGAAVRNGTFHEVHVGHVADITVPPGGTASAEFSAAFPDDGPVSDYHYVKFPVCLNGSVSVLTHPVYLRA